MTLRLSDLYVDIPESLLGSIQAYINDYISVSPQGGADICVHRDLCELGEQLPLHDRMIVHGVAMNVKGEGAYIITAPSRTGKSTHAALWQRLLGHDNVEIINGDKPIIHCADDVTVCGSPWCGKEGLHRNISAPLRGMILLHRLDDEHPAPEIRRIADDAEASATFIDFMMEQTFLPQSPDSLRHTFQLLQRVYDSVPIYLLYADMTKQCIQMTVDALTSGSAPSLFTVFNGK